MDEVLEFLKNLAIVGSWFPVKPVNQIFFHILDPLSVYIKSTLVLASENTSVERLYKIFHFQNDKAVNLYADVDGE